MNNIFRFSFEQTDRVPSFIYEIDKLSFYIANIKSSLSSFKKYLSPILVKKYLLDGMEAKLGGKEKEVTVMFIDIENYTKLSESYSKEELIKLLDDFCMIVTKSIEKYRGTIDKFIGDSIMAFWGGIDDLNEHALLACECAMDCLDEIRKSNLNINIRIGINTGDVVIGNFGSKERFNFTVLGDNVNQASRLESSNKIYRTKTLVSEATYSCIRNYILTRKIDDVILKGRKEMTSIYEVMGWTTPRLEKLKRIYENGLAEYQRQNWAAAIEFFSQALEIVDGDGPSLILKERCEFYRDNPPGEDWDGIFSITQK